MNRPRNPRLLTLESPMRNTPTGRRYSAEEKAAAVRMVWPLSNAVVRESFEYLRPRVGWPRNRLPP